MPKFFTRFDRPETKGITFSKPSLTEQSHKQDCDINVLVSNYARSGILGDPSSYRPLVFGDFSKLGSLQEQRNALSEISSYFDQLPSETREAFSNDPMKLVDAFLDPSKKDLLLAHKLVKAEVSDVATPLNPVDRTVSQEVQASADASAQSTT